MPIKRQSSVLEIGFGNGVFAGWAKEQGFEYLGTEAIDELVALGQRIGFRVIASPPRLVDAVAEESQDVIVAFDVIEHFSLKDIQVFLQDVRGLLRPEGRLLLRIPSGDSPFARAIQYGDVTHRLILGSSAIRQLAQMAQLEVLQIRSPVLPLWGVGLKRRVRRVLLRALRKVLTTLVQVSFHDAQQTVISSNMVVVLRKPASLIDVPAL